MEWWTLAVITVESTAQIFYQSLKDATECKLLKQICTDILIDEAAHIRFQMERMSIVFDSKRPLWKWCAYYGYTFFYYSTAVVVWMAHKKVFRAGGNSLRKYLHIMDYKFKKTLAMLKIAKQPKPVLQTH